MLDATPEPVLTHAGVRIPNDPGIVTRQIARAIRAGRYEKAEMRGLPMFLDASDSVVELGAGLGFVSSFLGVHLGLTRTLCIEANPALAPFIRRTHAANGLTGIDVVTGVGGAVAGTAPFYIRDPFWASSLSPKEAYLREETVPRLPLGDILRERGASALIVDIEGGEADLFETLDPGPVEKIYFELHTRYIGQRGVMKCFADLARLGFCYDQRVSSAGALLFRRAS